MSSSCRSAAAVALSRSTAGFGADMLVASENDGPVTILLDTDELLQPRRG